MSQITLRTPRGLSSYPLTRNLDPIGSYPLTRNLNPYGSYPLTRNLDPLGDVGYGSLLSGVGSILGAVMGGGSGGGSAPPVIINNEPPPQPAPPVPFNWTPVIVSGGVILVILTMIMTSGKK